MAGGAGGDLFGLVGRAACVLFWRGAEKILGAGGLANGDGASRRIPDELFGIGGEFGSAGADGARQREEVDRYCGVAGRAGGGGENVCASDYRLRSTLEGIRGILRRRSWKNGERGTSGCADPGRVRVVASERVARHGQQSLPVHRTRGRIPHLGRE